MRVRAKVKRCDGWCARRLSGYLLFGLLLPVSGFANDSTAVIGAGGIELTKSNDIVLEFEDLYISSREVRVRYEFRNISKQDIHTTVAFPMPLISDTSGLSPLGTQTKDPVNYMGFRVAVNGSSVVARVECKAIQGGRDVTGVLTDLGLPVSALDPEVDQQLKSPNIVEELLKQGLVFTDGSDSYYPFWGVKTTYHWEQTFPSKEKVVIEHSYKPIVGGWYFPAGVRPSRKHCLDDRTAAGIRKLLQRQKNAYATSPKYANDRHYADFEYLAYSEVRYILTTARNWAGTIGRFRLTIDKGRPENIVSLCIDTIKKTGPTTFVAEYEDYVPSGELNVLFVSSFAEL